MPPPVLRASSRPERTWSAPPWTRSTPPLSWSRLPPLFGGLRQPRADLVDAVDERAVLALGSEARAQLGDACVERLRLFRETADAVVQLRQARIDPVEAVGHLSETVEQLGRLVADLVQTASDLCGTAVDLRGATAQLLGAGVELAGPVGDLAGSVGDLGRAVLRRARRRSAASTCRP